MSKGGPRKRIPNAEWYTIINQNNEVVMCGGVGPGKEWAMRELRNLRRQRIFDRLHMVPEGSEPEDVEWHPE